MLFRSRYDEPVLELRGISVQRRGAALAGDMRYNVSSGEGRFGVKVSSLELSSLADLGVPGDVQGEIVEGQFSADGTLRAPNLKGTATLKELGFYGESFPAARVTAASEGSLLILGLDINQNANLTARIDSADAKLPFTAQASFTNYSANQIGRAHV